jgi:hypothetical protein
MKISLGCFAITVFSFFVFLMSMIWIDKLQDHDLFMRGCFTIMIISAFFGIGFFIASIWKEIWE